MVGDMDHNELNTSAQLGISECDYAKEYMSNLLLCCISGLVVDIRVTGIL